MSSYEHFVKANDPSAFHYKLDDSYSLSKNNAVLHNSCLKYEAKLFDDKVKSEKKKKNDKKKEGKKDLSAFPDLKDPYQLMRHYQ